MACKCSLIFRIGVLHQIGTSERMSSGSTAPCPKNLKIFGHALTTHCIPSTDLHLDPLPIYANKCAHTSFFSHPGFDPVLLSMADFAALCREFFLALAIQIFFNRDINFCLHFTVSKAVILVIS